MKVEDLNALLEELTKEETNDARRLEIYNEIRTDKEKSISDFEELSTNTAKLQNDYNELKKKSVEDFFHKGTNVTSQNNENNTPDIPGTDDEEELTYADLIESEE